MRSLLFLSRLSFICGVCFLLSLSLLFKDWTKEQDIVGTLLIIGFVIGIIIVPITLIWYLVVIIRGKKLPVPLWLVIGNILSLFALLFYIIVINGQNNHTP